MRWVSLASLSAFGLLTWVSRDQRISLGALNLRVAVYLILWGLTVIGGVFPLFSIYRLLAHVLVVVSCLVLLPQAIQLNDGNRALIVLKALIAVTLIISWVNPAPLTSYDSANQFRGIFGNSNSLGHMAAIGCLLFMHGFLTASNRTFGKLELLLTIFCGYILIRSGARSSSVALLAGLVALFVIRKEMNTRNLLAGWGVVLSGLILAITLQSHIVDFVFKSRARENPKLVTQSISYSRLPTWSASWEGFKQRPLLGWGFGVDSDTDLSNWHGQFTAIGFTGRDALNDLTFTLETGGIVGCFAYFFLLAFAIKLWIPPLQAGWLSKGLQQAECEIVNSAIEAQQAFACLTVMLIVLFEFDDTALSAGSFPSVLLWTSLGFSAALRTMLTTELPQRVLTTYLRRMRLTTASPSSF
jgi:Lipid A core - O-antigen ligase and related enzymes